MKDKKQLNVRLRFLRRFWFCDCNIFYIVIPLRWKRLVSMTIWLECVCVCKYIEPCKKMTTITKVRFVLWLFVKIIFLFSFISVVVKDYMLLPFTTYVLWTLLAIFSFPQQWRIVQRTYFKFGQEPQRCVSRLHESWVTTSTITIIST